MKESQSQFELETMIDRLGFCVVLGMLQTICYEKAEHIRENWQDGTSSAERQAKEWVNNAKAIQKAEKDCVF